jgi:hypothetical protein
VAHADVGHAIVDALQRRRYPHTVAAVAGHLGAVGTAYNWQGNTRIAELIHRSRRTVQRARARLEADGLIRSHLLLTGDLIEGQRSPVRHPQVVRDVSRLQRLAGGRGAPLRQQPPARQRKPSAAETPARVCAEQSRATAEELAELAEARPEFAAFFHELAEAARARAPRTPPSNCPREIDPREIDEWDRVTLELEREIAHRCERDPPERGPPPDVN